MGKNKQAENSDPVLEKYWISGPITVQTDNRFFPSANHMLMGLANIKCHKCAVNRKPGLDLKRRHGRLSRISSMMFIKEKANSLSKANKGQNHEISAKNQANKSRGQRQIQNPTYSPTHRR